MDAELFKAAYARLRALDELHTHKIRPRAGSSTSLEQLERRHTELANYSIELREVVDELFRAIAGRPTD